ncbi:hypothetical protein LB543_27710 [Mesorhizobium sp. ESP7-2]|uniref:hypothetical protein n=1 Tax=Mesorhizobium sp. ESP7-2 TaxID=2876622 RepID=UPI001CCCF961|nr:hypothetical protein [Mesorhizobium sp. ESP7-2]MBZ9710490.1 hypothetical protein [Mesorhizobium sp. ESP7-2]
MSDTASRPIDQRERQRRYRERKREQKRELRGVFVDLGDIADGLIERGYLQQWDAEDQDKIAAAAASFLKALSGS